jgi:DNA-binding SARP family transcriptional activator
MAFNTFLALASAQSDAGDWNAAISTLNNAIRFDPLAEEAYRRLMTLQIDHGLCNDAIRNYRFLAEVLRRELKTQPDPSTTAIYQRAAVRPQQTPQTAQPSNTAAANDTGAARVETHKIHHTIAATRQTEARKFRASRS